MSATRSFSARPAHAGLRACVAVTAFVLAATLPWPAAAGAEQADRTFDAIAQRYFDHDLERHPDRATRLGIHGRDGKLVAVTQATLDADAAWYRTLRDALAAVPAAELSFDRAVDHALLSSRVEAELYELETLRPWEHDPNEYVGLIAGSIQSLLDRRFASTCRRMRDAGERLSRVPEVLRAARINLHDSPRVYVETAIRRFESVLDLYRNGIVETAAGCRDPETQARLAEGDTLAVRAVVEFIAFLRDDLLPRSVDEFAIGEEAYRRRLAYEHMEEAPLDSLLARGMREIGDTHARMERLAEQIAPGRGVQGALDVMNRDHPAADSLVPFVSSQLADIRAFIREHDLLTLPARDKIVVRETPGFRRGTSFASYEGPGPWETKANDAYYNVTPVEPSWTGPQREDHLALFNRYASQLVSIHEVLPGHHVQGLYRSQLPSDLRRLLRASTSSEGWAHYCEQMMLEEGYGGGDPRIEMAQCVAAIQRLGRLVVGISLHTRGMTQDEAARFFEEHCYMAPINAGREARRGTMDPLYLVYTLGKWRILDLREEARQALGDRFSLRAFHDAFLRAGPLPLPLARRVVLHTLGVPPATN